MLINCGVIIPRNGCISRVENHCGTFCWTPLLSTVIRYITVYLRPNISLGTTTVRGNSVLNLPLNYLSIRSVSPGIQPQSKSPYLHEYIRQLLWTMAG